MVIANNFTGAVHKILQPRGGYTPPSTVDQPPVLLRFRITTLYKILLAFP